MGNFSSQETTNIVTEFIDTVNSAVVNITNTNTATCSGTQIIEPTSETCTVPFTCDGCIFIASQTAKGTCSVSAQNLTDISIKFNNEIKSKIENFTKEKVDQGNGWLATGFNLSGSTITNQDQLNEQLENLFNVDVKNTCQASVNLLQIAKYPLCGTFKNSPFNFTQDLVATSIVTCINQTMVTAYASNSALNDFVNNTDIAVSQKNAGLFDILIYAIIAFAIVSIVGAIAYYYFQGGQPPPGERRPSPYGQQRPPGYGERRPYGQGPSPYGHRLPPQEMMF